MPTANANHSSALTFVKKQPLCHYFSTDEVRTKPPLLRFGDRQHPIALRITILVYYHPPVYKDLAITDLIWISLFYLLYCNQVSNSTPQKDPIRSSF
jgi:hypothetical protein